jgi:regulator of RNase E activity RraA
VIGDPPRLVIRAKFPHLSKTELAPFRNRTTSFAVDAMNGRGALDLIEPGDVVVIATQGFTGTATFGDNIARIAQ